MIKHAHQMLPSISSTPVQETQNNQQEIMSSTIIVDAPQALADRRSTNIADPVAIQPQCLQGGIVPVRVHTLHTVG